MDPLCLSSSTPLSTKRTHPIDRFLQFGPACLNFLPELQLTVSRPYLFLSSLLHSQTLFIRPSSEPSVSPVVVGPSHPEHPQATCAPALFAGEQLRASRFFLLPAKFATVCPRTAQVAKMNGDTGKRDIKNHLLFEIATEVANRGTDTSWQHIIPMC